MKFALLALYPQYWTAWYHWLVLRLLLNISRNAWRSCWSFLKCIYHILGSCDTPKALWFEITLDLSLLPLVEKALSSLWEPSGRILLLKLHRVATGSRGKSQVGVLHNRPFCFHRSFYNFIVQLLELIESTVLSVLVQWAHCHWQRLDGRNVAVVDLFDVCCIWS